MLLSTNGAQIVLWLHVLAACVWIGGQIAIGMVAPMLRSQPQLLATVARRAQVPLWIGFAILVVTGLANIHNAGIDPGNLGGTATGRTLVLKLILVLISGLAAAIHAFALGPRASRERTRAARTRSGMLGGISLLAAVLAALYGVVIAQH